MMAIVAMIVSILTDLYIIFDIRKSSARPLWWKLYAFSAVLCWIFLLVIVCLPKRSEDNGIIPIMWMLYAWLSVYVAKIIYVVVSLIGRLVRAVGRIRSRHHPSRWIGLGLAVFFFVMMWVGIGYTRRHIMVNEVQITSPKLPEVFSGYTIAQVSDLHVGTWGNDTSFVADLVDRVNSLHPDLIVFTGDIVNRKTDEIEPFLHTLSRLSAPDGVFSILGNHDYGDYVDWKDPADREENNRRLAHYQDSIGWTLLNNERRYIVRGNDSITLIGVENWGDPPFPVYGSLEKALSASRDSLYHQNDSRFKVLLTHNPEHWNQEVSHSTNIDLTLTGHTHAMQMMISLGNWKWSPAKYRYEQWGGLYERLNDRGRTVRMYVNIGSGEVGMPSRLLSAYPEITLLRLEPEKK